MDFDQLYQQIRQESDLRKKKEQELYDSGHLQQQQQLGGQPLALALMSPSSFDECVDIAYKIKENKRIILNMEKLSPEVRGRVLDFVSGAALVRDYNVKQISANAIILARGNDMFETLEDEYETEE